MAHNWTSTARLSIIYRHQLCGQCTRKSTRIALENGVYSIDELVAHIQAMLRLQDDHPNYQQKWLVTKKKDNAGEIEGIQLVCDQISPAPASTSSGGSAGPGSGISISFPSNLVNVNYGDGGTDIVYSSAIGEVSRAAGVVPGRAYLGPYLEAP